MRTSLSALLICLGVAASSAPAQVAFDAPRIYRTGISPSDAIAADVDGDGHQDFVVATSLDRTASITGSLTVLFGDGRGGFRSTVETAIGVTCFTLASADFDEDDHADLVALLAPDRIVSLRGDGAGAFSAPIDLGTASPIDQNLLLTGDLDDDGHADLVARLSTGVTLFLGDGSGGLHAAGPFTLNGIPRVATAADVDADGRTDLVIGHQFGFAYATVFRGNATGGFSAGQQIELFTQQMSRRPSQPTGIAVVDLNHDGRADIVAVASGIPVALLANGTGGFNTVLDSPPGGDFHGFGLADFDRDGDWDLVCPEPYEISTPGSGGLRILSGDGAGRFAPTSVLPTGRAPSFVVAADWNEDGRPDVGAIDRIAERVVIRLAIPGGKFLLPRTTESGLASPLVVSDVDEDGNLDLVGTHFVLPSDGAMGYGTAEVSDPELETRIGVAVADFDSDGHVDRLVTGELPAGCGHECGVAPAYSFQQGFGDGSFGSPAAVQLTGLGLKRSSICVGDFDEDGHLDFAAPWRLWVTVFLGRGDGSFGPQALLTPAQSTEFLQVETADFDHDGHLDLFASTELQAAALFLGFGDGTFAPALPVEFRTSPDSHSRRVYRFAIADFDRDGSLDVAILFETSFDTDYFMRLAILLGDGLGAFEVADFVRIRRRGASSELTHFLVAADFDEDGFADVAAVSERSPDLFVCTGDGAGGLSEPIEFETGGLTATSLATADLDGDGHADLVASNSRTANASILYNRSFLAPYRVGNVNVAAGPITNVFFINGSAGVGDERRVVVPIGSPLEIRIDEPPSRVGQGAGFALYDWKSEPNERTAWRQPFGLGFCAMPTPLNRGAFPQPHFIANTLSHPVLLGFERWPGPPTTRAPSILLNRPRGVGRPGSSYFQAFIRDSAGPNGQTATTNGIVLEVR